MLTNSFIIIWASLGLKMKEYSDWYPTSQQYYCCKLYLVEISCLTPTNYKPRGNIWYGIITSCHHWFRLWILAFMAPNHYMKNGDLLSMRSFGTKFSKIRIKIRINLFINLIYHQLNWYENFVGKMLTICYTSMCWAMIMVMKSIDASWSTLVQVKKHKLLD